MLILAALVAVLYLVTWNSLREASFASITILSNTSFGPEVGRVAGQLMALPARIIGILAIIGQLILLIGFLFSSRKKKKRQHH